mmetsp:Transcript_8581/g.31927  ORF Transcript_8581/g.31927 Transcript_8581/m.31927 type:complete len:266 (-) Transcript_8581:25-822(-)
MNRVFKFHVVAVALFQKRLRVHHILPNRARLPRKVRPAWVDLEQARTCIVKASHQERHPERSNTPLLRELLHRRRRFPNQLRRRDGLVIRPVIRLRLLSRHAREHSKVRSHPRVRHPDRIRQRRNLLHRRRVHERARKLLLRRQHHAIFRLNPQRRRPRVNRRQRVFNLHQLPRRRERRQRKRIPSVRHGEATNARAIVISVFECTSSVTRRRRHASSSSRFAVGVVDRGPVQSTFALVVVVGGVSRVVARRSEARSVAISRAGR